MTKKILLLVLIFFMSLIVSGCWNYHELSDFAIISAIGIEKDKKDYKISMLIANATDQTSGNKPSAKTTIISGKGKTITEAFDDIKAKSSKDIYTGHLSLILIDEKIAKEGIYDIIDPIMRNPETIKKMSLVIAKEDKTNDILKTLSPLESYPSQNILLNINNSIQTLGISHDVLLSDFIYKIINYGYDNILPSITIEGKDKLENSIEQLEEIESEHHIKVDDIAIFDNYKLVDYANELESKAINIIANKSTSLSLKSKCYKDLDKYIVVKINDAKTKIKLDLKDKIKYTFNIKANAAIHETNCNLNLKDPKTIENISNYVKSELYDMIKNTINKTKKLKTDIFGLGNILYKQDYKYWNNIKDNWKELYSNLNYKIEIDLKITEKGALETTIKDMTHEKN